jgi:hypothetical protein
MKFAELPPIIKDYWSISQEMQCLIDDYKRSTSIYEDVSKFIDANIMRMESREQIVCVYMTTYELFITHLEKVSLP